MVGVLGGAALLLIVTALAVRNPVQGWDRGLALVLITGFLAVELVLFGVFRGLGLDLEHDAGVLWAAVALGSMALCAGASALREKTAGAELVAAIAVAMLVAAAGASVLSEEQGLASAPVRALLVAGPMLLLCGYFGSSLGFLLRGSGETDAKWGYESKVGRRFLLSKSSPVVSTVTTISVVGVMLGVAAVLVSLAVLAGFENDLREKIIGAHAHALFQRADQRPFELSEDQRAVLESAPGVAGYAPVIEEEVAIASRSNFTGGLVLGVDPVQSEGVITILDRIVAGGVEPLSAELVPTLAPEAEVPDDEEFPAPAPLPSILIGAEMARSLAVQTGDTVRLLSPTLSTL
ncbi:MAG: ABC transporter permease, partial [Myxococcota bacterium]